MSDLLDLGSDHRAVYVKFKISKKSGIDGEDQRYDEEKSVLMSILLWYDKNLLNKMRF